MKYLALILFFAGNVYAQECIDSDGDGWGWDGSKSCRVTATVTGCDYSNAGASDGWGWDASTGMSCPPIDTGTAPLQQSLFSINLTGKFTCRQELLESSGWEPGLEDDEQDIEFDGDNATVTIRSNFNGTRVLNEKWSFTNYVMSIGSSRYEQVGFAEGRLMYLYNRPGVSELRSRLRCERQ